MAHDVSSWQVDLCFWCNNPLPECHVPTFRHDGTFINSCPGCALIIGSKMSKDAIKAREAQIESV